MEYNSPKFRKWLDKLQRESWQLELIISGFAIYGLITALEPIESKAAIAMYTEQTFHSNLWGITSASVFILILNLTIHVVMRGLWIGAIGLRYVSGDIDFDALNYSEKFTTYLKEKVGSFDKFIAKLENFCSILFAISFLMIFYLIALYVFFGSIATLLLTITEIPFIPKTIKKVLAVVIIVIVGISALLALIDFIGQGILKKRKWTSKLYFPFYKLLSVVTLSFLYRPIIYNFLDNRFAKKFSILIVPFYLSLAVLSSFQDVSSNYLDSDKPSSESVLNNDNYENNILKNDSFVTVAAIPSKTVETPYLKVFLLYKKEMEDFVFESDSILKTEEDKRGASFGFIEDFKQGIKYAANKGVFTDSILPKYLKVFNKLYLLDIDGKAYPSDFLSSENNKGMLGFETYLNIRTLAEGKHLLTITGPIKEDDFDENSNTITKTIATIPFWYFPENPTASIVTKTMTKEKELDSVIKKGV